MSAPLNPRTGYTVKNLVPNSQTRWYPLALNGKQDGKVAVLEEGLQLLEERLSANYPTLLSANAALVALDNSVEQTDLGLTGVNLVGDGVKATGTTGAGAGSINWTAVLPGDQSITITIATDAGLGAGVAAVDVSYDDGDWTVDITHNAATAAAVVAAVAAGQGRFVVVGVVGAAGTADNDEVELTGGEGAVPTLSLGDIDLNGQDANNGITSFTDEAIVFDVDTTSWDPGTLQILQLRTQRVLVPPVAFVVNSASNLAADSVGPDQLQDNAVENAHIADNAVDTDQIADEAVETSQLAANAVVGSKFKFFLGQGRVATGAQETIAHGLPAAPVMVLVVVVQGHNGGGGAGTQVPLITKGVHTATDILVTVDAGATYDVFAF